MARPKRRDVLSAMALALAGAPLHGRAAIIQGALPWSADRTQPPTPVTPGGWQFFTADEAATIEALVDRLIPPDPETPGGKDAGCAVFIDRQLAGPTGISRGFLTLKSHLTQRYGAGFVPSDATIQDWGVSYEELEPHYDRFEYLCGTSGTAGNLNGAIQSGGNA